MGILSVVTAAILDRPLGDPDGFLGPAWVRLPMLLFGALILDLLPRTLWATRFKPKEMPAAIRERLRTHWTRERLTLVFLGVVCFYITYVSYRNLKSFLPFVIDIKYDRELHMIDRTLFFGTEPAIVIHAMFTQTWVVANVLSTIYLWFLPLVPLALTGWLIWSRNISFGYWFATSQCIAWSLGTASYYALPTVGPGFEYVQLYTDLPDTGSGRLMEALANGRTTALHSGVEGAMQTVAGFASLHTAITLLVALMVQYTLRSRALKVVFWTNFAITVVATLYFGWHYVADDIAGLVIALVSFYVGGRVSGQRFERRFRSSYPTTDSARVPISND